MEFRFRNGSKVSFEAQEINVQKLLDDVKAYLKDPPKQLDWNEMNIADIGARLVRENQSKYLLKQVAAWDLELKPREHHFDRRITVATPLQRAGAYLLSAKMEGGNTSYIVMWVADTAIVRKPMDKQIYCFVADAVTGRPIAKANVEFFGYRQEWVNDPITRAGRPVVYTADSAEFTDADGQVTYAPKRGQRRRPVPVGHHRHHAGGPAGVPGLHGLLADEPLRRRVQRRPRSSRSPTGRSIGRASR